MEMFQFVCRRQLASRSSTRFLRLNLKVNAMMPLIEGLISDTK